VEWILISFLVEAGRYSCTPSLLSTMNCFSLHIRIVILQFLHRDSDFLAVNDLNACEDIVNNHFNVLAVLQHDRLDLALHNESRVLALD
jgi:hypothetical protein